MENAKNKVSSFEEVMNLLWDERKKSGDFTVISKKDGKKEKYHKIVLFYLNFFKGQSNPNFKANNDEHITLLSISSFDALLKYIYTGETSQLGPLECAELLQMEDGINFYFATSKSEEVITLRKILEENIKNVTKENCLSTLLYALHATNEELKEICFSQLIENPPFFVDQIKNNYQDEEQKTLSFCVMTYLANYIYNK